jgi:hypothetical protein
MHRLRRLSALLPRAWGARRVRVCSLNNVVRWTFALLLSCCFGAYAWAAEQSATNDWIMVPGNRVGPITFQTSEAKLREIFGEPNVRRENIYVGEGETTPGTVLFPNDQEKTLAIFWSDDKPWISPRQVRLKGSSFVWKTDKSISLGTRLKAVERINGRPFILAGFGWDYGGTTIHSNGGRLRELGIGYVESPVRHVRDRLLSLRFEVDDAQLNLRHYRSVNGDRDFSSGHPAMQRLNPRVDEIFILFTANNL